MDQHGWCKLWRPLKTENLSTNQQTKIKITNQQYPTITCIYCKNANQWLSMTKLSAQSQSTYHKMDLKNGSMDLPISWVPNQHFKCRLPCNCTATGAECGLGKWGSYPPLRVYWWTHHWGIEGKKGSLGRLRVSNFGTEPFHPSWTWTRSLSLSFFSNMRPVRWWRWHYPAIRHPSSFAAPAEQYTALGSAPNNMVFMGKMIFGSLGIINDWIWVHSIFRSTHFSILFFAMVWSEQDHMDTWRDNGANTNKDCNPFGQTSL